MQQCLKPPAGDKQARTEREQAKAWPGQPQARDQPQAGATEAGQEFPVLSSLAYPKPYGIVLRVHQHPSKAHGRAQGPYTGRAHPHQLVLPSAMWDEMGQVGTHL